MAAGAGRLSAAPKIVLPLSDLRGHGVFASSRLGVVASAKVLAPSGGEVFAMLRMVVVRQRLQKHRGDIRPAVSIEVSASCLTKGTDVDGVGRKCNI